MFSFLLVVQVIVCICIIGLVMMQQGKGADMGAAFGSGSAGTVFGAAGGGSFLTRATAFLAAIFFINCLLIASPLIRNNDSGATSIAEALEQQESTVMEAPQPAVMEAPLSETDLPDVMDEPQVDEGTTDLPE